MDHPTRRYLEDFFPNSAGLDLIIQVVTAMLQAFTPRFADQQRGEEAKEASSAPIGPFATRIYAIHLGE